MPTDRLARLRALMEHWKGQGQKAHDAADRYYAVGEHSRSDKMSARGDVYKACAAELESVLADPPQNRPQDTYHWGEPMKQYAALGIGVEAWVELEREERRAVDQNLRDLSGVAISYRTFRLVMTVLRAIRLEDFRAAPTPADGAPQEQEP